MNSEPKAKNRISGQTRKKNKQRKENLRNRLLAKIPKNGFCVEIGVWRGEFSKVLLRTLTPERLILIDPWEPETQADVDEALSSRTGADEMDKIYASIKKMFKAQIAAGQVDILREKSTTALTKISAQCIDFAYVDGDHSYEGVRADLALLLPRMKPSGVIALDDYHRRGWWGDGVIRAVNEFIGTNASDVRVQALEGAQVAIQILPHTKKT